jgi:LysM repeat protein
MAPSRLILALTALFSLRTVAAVVMTYQDALPTNLSTTCSNAILTDVACDPLVRDLRTDFFYRPASLERMCTSDCSEALSSWKDLVRSSCGDETVPADFELPASAVVIPATLEYLFAFTCLRESDRFCGPVAALAAVFNDPGVTVFNYLDEVPEGAEEPSICDACLAARLRMRAGSPYFDDPVVASESLYQSLTSSCGITSRPVTTTTIDYSTSEPSPTDVSCDGVNYTIQDGDNCYSISEAQGVGTAWMLSDNNLGAYCDGFPTSGTICITNMCENVKVETNETCSEIAVAAGITETQLKAYNPIINPVCSNLFMMNGTTLCIEPPGPRLPPPAETDVPPVIPTTAAPKPTDAAEGSNERCGRWYEVEAGDYCNMVILKFAISLQDFLFLNSGINVNCTNLFAEESYCVQAVGDLNTYSGRPGYISYTLDDPAATFTGVPFTNLPNGTATRGNRGYTPAPLATGVRDDCVHYFVGDEYQFEASALGYWASNCELAARNYNADDDTFAAWNSLANVTDPACGFEVGRRYCGSWNVQAPITITETTPPSPTTSGGAPGPTHSGQPADCNKWHVVKEGDSCQSVADQAGISAEQFFNWNPVVSKDCTTNFWLGQAYCVGIPGDGGRPTTTTASATTTEAETNPTPPGPTHTGQPANCNKWDIVEEGDSCSSIASDNGISTDQFFAWNPAVSRDCISNFWLGNAYCVGISSSGSNPPTTTTTTTRPTTTRSPTAPAPTHTGQPSNCNKWDVVVEGDSCGSLAADNGISTDQFFTWNPAVSRDCVTNFWLGQAYCVGVSSGRTTG